MPPEGASESNVFSVVLPLLLLASPLSLDQKEDRARESNDEKRREERRRERCSSGPFCISRRRSVAGDARVGGREEGEAVVHGNVEEVKAESD